MRDGGCDGGEKDQVSDLFPEDQMVDSTEEGVGKEPLGLRPEQLGGGILRG